MKHFFTLALSLTLLSVAAQPCINGMSGGYPCNNVDQISFVGVGTLGGEEMNDVWGWTSPETGREYVCAGHNNGTAFLDISNPENPIFLGMLPTNTSSSIWRDIKVYDHYAFIVSEAAAHGMQVFDLHKLENLSLSQVPTTFTADAVYEGFGNAHNLAINPSQPYAYAIGTGTFSGGPHIVNIADPLNPVYAGSSAEAGYSHDAQIVTYSGPDADYTGHEICIGSNEDFMVVYDVTDKTDVEVISVTPYDYVTYAHQSWFTEDQRYMLSNDEQDELYQPDVTGTRTIIWDMQDLDNPQVTGYYNIGIHSIDHNLYIRENVAYMSNYTSGLRILDIIGIAAGNLSEFAFFDVAPNNDLLQFEGTWSNYPFFESRVVPTTSIGSGLFMLYPRLVETDEQVSYVCEDDAVVQIEMNIHIPDATLSLNMENIPGNNANFSTISPETPGTATLTFTGSAGAAEGYYSGEVVVAGNDFSYTLPIHIVVGNPADVAVLQAPINGEEINSQNAMFNFNLPNQDLWNMQISTDSDFSNIVADFWGSGNFPTQQLPFDHTTYYWRIIQPGCNGNVVSATQEFVVNSDLVGVSEKTPAVKFLYPNPATSKLYITLAQPMAQLTVFDISGREIKSFAVEGQGTQLELNISDLEPGVYLLQTNLGGSATRFVVQ